MSGRTNRRAAVIFALAGILVLSGAAVNTEARSVSIYKAEGADVKITKGTPSEFAAKEGYKLNNGYTLATGADSRAYLQMDTDSILKMDESSKLAVSKASADKLSLTVQSGAALVDAGAQAAGNVIETRVGNAGLVIRGTKYVIGPGGQNETATVTMLEGGGEVNGQMLPAGSVMQIKGAASRDELAYDLHEGLETAEHDLFTLESIHQYADELVRLGIISQGYADGLPDAIRKLRGDDLAVIWVDGVVKDNGRLALSWDWNGMTDLRRADVERVEIWAYLEADPNSRCLIYEFNPEEEYARVGGEPGLTDIQTSLDTYYDTAFLTGEIYSIEAVSVPKDGVMYNRTAAGNANIRFSRSPAGDGWEYEVVL